MQGFKYEPNTTVPYNIINGNKIFKVVAPFYSDEKGVIYGKCPACGGSVCRIWNLSNCGNCGCEISWHAIHVDGWGDID